MVVAGQDVRHAEAQIEEGAAPKRLGDAHVDGELVRQIVKTIDDAAGSSVAGGSPSRSRV